MMQDIINAVLNTIFVSVPETLVWLIFSLILLKRKDFLDIYFWKENLIKMMPVVIPTAISVNLMRYILHVDNLVNFIIIEIIMCALVIYLIKKNNIINEKINYLKIILYVIFADFIIIITTEGISGLIIISILHMTIEQINNNIVLNITLSLIPRVFQILLLIIFIYKQSMGEMINYIEIILKNKTLTISMIVFLFAVGVSNFIFGRFIVASEFLNNYILTIKIVFIVLILLTPVVMITSYIISICNLLMENSKLQRTKDNIYNNDIM